MRAWMYPASLGVTRGVGLLSVDGIAGKVCSKIEEMVFLGLTFKADIAGPSERTAKSRANRTLKLTRSRVLGTTGTSIGCVPGSMQRHSVEIPTTSDIRISTNMYVQIQNRNK